MYSNTTAIENFQISSNFTPNERMYQRENIVTNISSPGHISVNSIFLNTNLPSSKDCTTQHKLYICCTTQSSMSLFRIVKVSYAGSISVL